MSAAHAAPPPPVAAAIAPARTQIGVAHMQADGTIVMDLRMVAGQGVGDQRIVTVPGQSDYNKLRAHLPALRPGKEVEVYDDGIRWDVLLLALPLRRSIRDRPLCFVIPGLIANADSCRRKLVTSFTRVHVTRSRQPRR